METKALKYDTILAEQEKERIRQERIAQLKALCEQREAEYLKLQAEADEANRLFEKARTELESLEGGI